MRLREKNTIVWLPRVLVDVEMFPIESDMQFCAQHSFRSNILTTAATEIFGLMEKWRARRE